MDEQPQKPISSWLHHSHDGRTWKIEDFGPGRVKATDIMSPTGYSEWVDWPRTGPEYRQAFPAR